MSPAIDRLERLGHQRLTAETILSFLAEGARLVLLTGDPQRVRESNDAAVIFPDLVRTVSEATGIDLVAGFLTPNHETDAVRAELGVLSYPSVVAYRDGCFAGVVPGMKAWTDFVSQVSGFFASSDAQAQTL
jgi:hypothetical protein